MDVDANGNDPLIMDINKALEAAKRKKKDE